MMDDSKQDQILNQACENVKRTSFFMKRAIDANQLDETIKHAIEMLSELRSKNLQPKPYYELYMTVLDEMRILEDFFSTLQRNGEKKMIDLYEQVQGCPSIVPRLYLLCCVGGIYIQSLETPAKDILSDMVEMVKGVQHPTRGLFLRNYLTQVTKSRLPDIGSPYEGEGGNVQDACTFILHNFIETNRLWIRLQTHGQKEQRKKREKERRDLRILVGSNLVQLSQLEGLDVGEYKDNLLPKLLEEVVNCKDTIAQGYLMDCIIQVFPDDYHLQTLSVLLDACVKLKEKVNVRLILAALVDRLAEYLTSSNTEVLPTDVLAFKLFNECVTTLIMERSNMTLVETLNLQTVLIDFALKCYAGKIEYVSHCLNTCCSLMEKSGIDSSSDTNTDKKDIGADVTETIEKLLSTVLSALALRVMELPHVAGLMKFLPWSNWKEVASNFLEAVVKSYSPITDATAVEQLYDMIQPMIRDESEQAVKLDENGNPIEATMSDEFKKEQVLVAKTVHLMASEDTDVQLLMYVTAKKYFTDGGKSRVNYTLPPLVYGALRLSHKVYKRELCRAEQIHRVQEREKKKEEKKNKKKVEKKQKPKKEEKKEEKEKGEGEGEEGDEKEEGEDKKEEGEDKKEEGEDKKEEEVKEEEVKEEVKEEEAVEETETEADDEEEIIVEDAPQFSSRKVLQFIIEIVTAMATSYPELSLKMFLEAAQASDSFNYSAIAYEFMKEALLVYETDIIDSRVQVNLLPTIIGTLINCRNFPADDYEALITKIAQYANRLLKTPDRSKMITICSHLFWPKRAGDAEGEYYDDSERVQECLERSLKIASTCNPMLFVNILDRYLYYFESGNSIIEARYINGIITLINEQFGDGKVDAASIAHYNNIQQYIRNKQASEDGGKFSEITL